MGKKKRVARPYRVYKYKNLGKVYERVKGPNGLDIHPENKDCAGCLALYMNIAYEEGVKSCLKK